LLISSDIIYQLLLAKNFSC